MFKQMSIPKYHTISENGYHDITQKYIQVLSSSILLKKIANSFSKHSEQ